MEAAGANIGRHSTTTRGEEPTGLLPGLAAAGKEQAASHDLPSLADARHAQ